MASTLATTTTSGGRYAFNLKALGVKFSSDLAVRVNGLGGAQLRAFVSRSDVDIGPASEAAVRLIVEQILLNSGASLANLTTTEINDLVSSIDLLSSLQDSQSGTNIETTVDALLSLIRQDTGIMAFLTAAAEAGQTAIGTGDIGNLVPFEQGNLWHRLVEDTEQPQPYLTAEELSGTRLFDSTLATVHRYYNFDNTGTTVEDYSHKDSRGIVFWGTNDPDDPISTQLAPFTEVNFPLALGITQQIINRTGLTYLEDLDLDGRNETFNVTATVTPVGTEAVSVQAGTFADTLRLETDIAINVKLSSAAVTLLVNEIFTQWLYPDIGTVKETMELSATGPGVFISESSNAELLGYRVAGTGKGILPKFTIVDRTSVAGSDTMRPGRPGIATDGDNYLVVTCRDVATGGASGLIGVFISDHDSVSSELSIAPHNCEFPAPSVAYNGSSYLVVFGRDGAIMGVRISSNGAVGTEFLISADASSNFSPRVASDGTNYLVVWNRYTGSDYDIHGALVSPADSIISAVTVFSAAGEQVSPDLAYNGTHFLVAWRDTRDGSGPSLTTDIYGTRIAPDGTVLDPGAIAMATGFGYQGEPGVASDGTGFFVAWLDTLSLGSDPVENATFRGKLIDANGGLVGSTAPDKGTVINASPYGKAAFALSFNGTDYLLAWRVGAYNTSPPAGLFAARISTSGVVLDGAADSVGLIVTGMPPDFAKYVYPSISSTGGHSLLAWSNNAELGGELKSVEAAYIFPW